MKIIHRRSRPDIQEVFLPTVCGKNVLFSKTTNNKGATTCKNCLKLGGMNGKATKR